MWKRMLLCLALALLAGIGLPTWAQDFPRRTIKVVVPYSAGGAVDVVARILAHRLTTQLGQPVIVENKPGAAGAIGVDAVAKSAPDGYTLLFTANSTHTTGPHVTKVPYNPLTDFTPISTVLDYSFILVVNPKAPVNTVAELVSYAKKNPTAVTFSSAGVGLGTHLAGELLKSITGAPMLHVPYKGNGPAMMAAISGEVTCVFDTTGTAINYIRGGQVRALAVTSMARNRMLPDLPTMIEAGVPGFDVVGWYGFMGPAHLPDPITNRFIQALKVVINDPAVEKQLRGQGFDIKMTMLQDFANRIKIDYALWGKVVSQIHIEKN